MATPPVFVSGAVLTSGQMNSIGLWKIVREDFVASASIVVNNCFSADFETYRILMRYTSTSGVTTVGMRLRVAGVNATSNYDRQTAIFADTTLTAVRVTAATSFTIESADTSRATFVAMDIRSPALAANTSFTSLSVKDETITSRFLAGSHSDTTIFDGFNLIMTGGVSITGEVSVYGYR